MDRRRFLLTSVAGALAAPRAANAQQTSKVYRIGLVNLMAPDAMAPYVEALQKGLRDLGYVEGQHFVFEHRSAHNNPEKLPVVAAELAQLKVDVILTGANQGVVAARKATTTIPIIMVYGVDPIGMGFIASLARPGGNVTGGTFEPAPEFWGKQLELLKQVAPRLTKVALLFNPASPTAGMYKKSIQDACRQFDVAFQAFEVRASSDYEAAFVAISKARADAVMVLTDPLTFPDRVPITRLASKFRVPVVATAREFAEAGALLSYAPNLIERWRHAALYVDKVLKGARPSEIPVEQPTKFELVINLKTAKTLGLTIPPSLLARADQVIE